MFRAHLLCSISGSVTATELCCEFLVSVWESLNIKKKCPWNLIRAPKNLSKEVDDMMWQKVDLLMDHRETMKDDERLVWQTKVIDPILASGLR